MHGIDYDVFCQPDSVLLDHPLLCKCKYDFCECFVWRNRNNHHTNRFHNVCPSFGHRKLYMEYLTDDHLFTIEMKKIIFLVFGFGCEILIKKFEIKIIIKFKNCIEFNGSCENCNYHLNQLMGWKISSVCLSMYVKIFIVFSMYNLIDSYFEISREKPYVFKRKYNPNIYLKMVSVILAWNLTRIPTYENTESMWFHISLIFYSNNMQYKIRSSV